MSIEHLVYLCICGANEVHEPPAHFQIQTVDSHLFQIKFKIAHYLKWLIPKIENDKGCWIPSPVKLMQSSAIFINFVNIANQLAKIIPEVRVGIIGWIAKSVK